MNGHKYLNNNNPRKKKVQKFRFIVIVHDNFFTQMMSQPTRIENIIDLILTTSTDYVQDILVGEPFSDHNQITLNINCVRYEGDLKRSIIPLRKQNGTN